MKYLTRDGKYWMDIFDGNANVGLTKMGMEEFGMFLVLATNQRTGAKVRQGQSLAAVEGVVKLGCLISPLEGTLAQSGDVYEERPEKITPESTLFSFINITIPPNITPIKEYNALSVL